MQLEAVNRKELIHSLWGAMADQVYAYIGDTATKENPWVAATKIKHELDLTFVAYPASNAVQQDTGWIFLALMRLLEDKHLVEHTKTNGRAFYRVKEANNG